MKPVQLAFDFPATQAAPARRFGRSMLARLAVLALSVAVLAPAGSALARSSYAVKDEIAALPFARAYAYQKAADEWCFLDAKLANGELSDAAFTQAGFTGVGDDLIKGMEMAENHLARDNSACAPAVDFVKRTINNLPALKAKLDALGAEYTRAEADEKAALEASRKVAADEAAAKARKRAEEQAATMRAAKLESCKSLTSTVGIPGDDNPYWLLSLATARQNVLVNCRGILTALQIDEAEKIIAETQARGERGAAAKRAEWDKVAADTIAKNKGKQ